MNKHSMGMMLVAALATAPALAKAPPAHAKVAGLMPGEGKVEAPVAIAIARKGNAAAIELTFLQEASNVSVRLGGVDGLAVQGSEDPIRDGHYLKGEVVRLTSGFEPGEGESHLAVFVQGQFASGKRSTVRTLTVGQRNQAQLLKVQANIQRMPDGTMVHVMEGEQR